MNQMTAALAQAGIPTPSVYERIWRYFQDKPRTSSLSCSQVLRLSRANSSSYISEMETRRMLRSELVELRVKGAHGVFHTRAVKHYSVNTAEFEMLPRPLTSKKKPNKAALKPVKTIDQLKVEIPQVKVSATPVVDINSMSLGQARALYDELKKVFG